ncbi:unnamed protein product, partial [Discosporangium mesarthrocarpum]
LKRVTDERWLWGTVSMAAGDASVRLSPEALSKVLDFCSRALDFAAPTDSAHMETLALVAKLLSPPPSADSGAGAGSGAGVRTRLGAKRDQLETLVDKATSHMREALVAARNNSKGEDQGASPGGLPPGFDHVKDLYLRVFERAPEWRSKLPELE